MADRAPPSEAQTLRAIERLVLDALPQNWSLQVRRPSKTRDVDAQWIVHAPSGETALFAIEVKRALVGRQLGDVLEQIGRAQGRPLIAAPFLSDTLRSTLAGRGVSYADATGNMRLLADRPGLFIERHGAARDPWRSEDHSLRSLRGRAAGRSVRALVDFYPPYGVRELADRAAVPLGSLSRTLELLDREGLVTRGDRGDVVDLDWERVLRRWVQDYSFARSNRLAYYLEPRGLAEIEQKLLSTTWPYALTGASAAQRFKPIAPARQVAVYVEDADRAGEYLHLRSAEAGANVVLAEPFDEVALERSTTRERLRVAAASQLAADLLTGPGREPSEGEELISWMRANDEAWRG